MSWTDRGVIAALARLLPVHRRHGMLATPPTIPALAPPTRRPALDHASRPNRSARDSAGVRALVIRLALEMPTSLAGPR
jgi:hypothetical protein